MPKRIYKVWSQANINEALGKAETCFKEICRTYNIPKPTFRRHLKKSQ
ncbi:unnamed protein product [Acanthoscelides obtectus]|uniref:Uncharacterized protein n=1 Tax=Acanthoscelides obtectus TaxID=200917 RepID=A0A9P0M6U9_ACAOB|nr:unnamed protein product [Acanthoscelides obtectus]